MTTTFTIDTSVWAAKVQQLIAQKGITGQKEFAKELRAAAKLVIRDAYYMTPPFGSQPVMEGRGGGGKQAEVGRAAVNRDARNVFLSPWRAVAMVKRSNPAAAVVAGQLAKEGRLEELKKFLQSRDSAKAVQVKPYTRSGQTVKGYTRTITAPRFNNGAFTRLNAVGAPNAAAHNAQRDNRGRVKNGYPRVLVTTDTALTSYIRTRWQQVGKAKSGWAQALKAMGSSPWKWTKQGGAGLYKEEGVPDKLTIFAGCGVPYIQAAAGNLRILKKAFENQSRNLAVRIEKATATAVRKILR